MWHTKTRFGAMLAMLFCAVLLILSSWAVPLAQGVFDPTRDVTVSGAWTFSGTAPAMSTGGALVSLTGTQTLTNKTLTSPTLTSPTLTTPAINQINDTSGLNRAIYNTVAKTIVDGSATSLFEVPIAASAYAAGFVNFAVFAGDGTDFQTISGLLTYSGVNKAATITRAATYVAANEAKSVSSGTLTLAFTATDDTNKMTVKLQPTGSLTETTYTIVYTVVPLKGTVTVL